MKGVARSGSPRAPIQNGSGSGSASIAALLSGINAPVLMKAPFIAVSFRLTFGDSLSNNVMFSYVDIARCTVVRLS